MTTWRCALVLALLVAASSAAPMDWPDRLAVTDLLRAEQYEDLTAVLSDYRRAVERGTLPEDVLEAAYLAFASSEPAFENRLADWIAAAAPGSGARTARAVYFWNLGLLSRGSRNRDSGYAERQAEMRAYFTRALADLRVAAAEETPASFALSLTIPIAAALGESNGLETLVQQALERAPNSFAVQRRYLDTLRPALGTPADEAQEALSALDAYVHARVSEGASPLLRGYPELIRADLLASRGERERAARHYDRALQAGELWLYRYRRGINALHLGQLPKALEDLDRALVLRPQMPRVMSARARVLSAQGNSAQALDEWEAALALNPFDPVVLLHYAYALRDAGRLDEAIRALNRALEHGSNNEYVWDARGRIFLYERHDFARAAADLAHAVELDPLSSRYRFNFATALYKASDCRAPAAMGAYLQICRSQTCPSENVAWMAEWQRAFDASVVCDEVRALRESSALRRRD